MEYTIEQIKYAFFETFNESGEIFFDYLHSDKENLKCTESQFENFKTELETNKTD